MKHMPVIFFVLMSVAHANAKGHKLECRDTNSSNTIFLTAEIVSDTTLRNVQVFANDDKEINPDKTDLATGTMVVSNHSPYKGDIQYSLNNDLVLLLPASLADSDLESTFESGIGYQKNENGVVIGHYEDGDAGNHFSVRLDCSSDK